MWVMMAGTEPGEAPLRNDYSPMAIYSIAWMFIGSYFALNLFVGVIVSSFDQIQKETNQSATMTVEQQQWVNAMRAMPKQAPAKGVKQWPKACVPCRLIYSLVTSSAFDGFITFIIIANIGLMSCEYWGMDEDEGASTAYNLAMSIFIKIYYCECVLKIAGLGPIGYFSDAWCRFDFFLVCLALADEMGSGLIEYLPLPPYLLRVLRVFRILRILRLLKGAKELRNLLVTMVLSFPSLINVGSLLAVVTFIYSVLGVHLFTFLVPQENINEVRNFETLSSGALLLFQSLTGDAWSAIMGDAMVDASSGKCSEEAGNCGSPAALPYFVSFQVVGVFVFLNLIVAIILENFSALGSQNPDVVSAADIETFKDIWVEFDPDADNYIPSKDLPRLVLALPPPMGLNGVGDEQDARKLCTELQNLNQKDGQISFQDTLTALTRHSYFNKKSKLDPKDLESIEKVPTLSPTKELVPKISMSPEALKMQSNAEQFADELPSVRRVFALEVIAQASVKWKAKKEAEPPLPVMPEIARNGHGGSFHGSSSGSFRNLGSRDLGKSMTLPPPSKRSPNNNPPAAIQGNALQRSKSSSLMSSHGDRRIAGCNESVSVDATTSPLDKSEKRCARGPGSGDKSAPSIEELSKVSAKITACRSAHAAPLKHPKPSPPRPSAVTTVSKPPANSTTPNSMRAQAMGPGASRDGLSRTVDHTCCGRQ